MNHLRQITICIVLALTTVNVAAAGKTEIRGTVIFEGDDSKYIRTRINTGKDPACKKSKEKIGTYSVIINKKATPMTLVNVLVSIKDGLGDRSFAVATPVVQLNQVGCEYTPHVLGVQEGAQLQVLNGDDTNHNIHLLPKVNDEINFTQPKKDTTVGRMLTLKAEDPFKVKCDVHPWMGCYIGVFNHPFFDVTGKPGTYSLKGMGPGTYTIEAWHETFGTLTAQVTVPEDGSVTQDFVFKPE